MDKKVLIQNITSAISSIIMSKKDKELFIQVFYGIAKELESSNSELSTVKELANTAKSTADTANSTAKTAKSTADTAKSTADTAKSTANTAKSTADGHTSKITALEGKTKAATTATAGIVKQMANIPKLAGTEEAAAICTKVNAILDGLKTATIMA